MTCKQCREVLLSATSAIALSADHRSFVRRARLHIQECPVCATRFSELTAMDRALDQLRSSMSQLDAPARLEASLARAFQHQRMAPKRLYWTLAWAPAFVLLLCAVSIVLHSTAHKRASKGGVITPKESVRDTRSIVSTITNIPAQAIHKSMSRRTVGTAAHYARKPLSVEKSPQATELRPAADPVHYDALALNGGTSVVRVRLPLSSLVAVGVPIYPDASNHEVTADIVRDPFGAVLAVHLVNAKTVVN